MSVQSTQSEAASAAAAESGPSADSAAEPAAAATAAKADRKTALKEQALADAGVQALLEVFPGGNSRRGGDVNIQQMMKQAQQMQERLQKQMAELSVEATAGGGMVTVVVNGAKQLQSLKIDPEVVSKEDVEMLQDLIRRRRQRRPAQGRRGAGREDGRA